MPRLIIPGMVTHLWRENRFKTWVGFRHWYYEMPKARLNRTLNHGCCALFYFGITLFDCVRNVWGTRKVSRLTAWERIKYHIRWFKTVLLYHYNSQKGHFKLRHVVGLIHNRYLIDWNEVNKKRDNKPSRDITIAAPSKIYAD